jgi:Fe-S cluster biogenesis protein NfuA/nitrite reductase/ring-hydroxylating ferredoxin subunit
MGFEFADKERVTVLDLMAEAAATTPGLAPPGPPPGPMSQETSEGSQAPLDPSRQPASATLPSEGAGSPQGAKPEDLEGRIEWLTAELEALPDSRTRGLAEELVSGVLELHGKGLGRVLELVDEAGSAGAPIREALVDDGVVASLLLIHDLYPVSLEERVAEALASVQPYMESHGGGVELLSLQDGVARLRLHGSCDGCAASSATLELAIKKALMETAPDLVGLDVEGAVEPPSANGDMSGTPLPIVPKPARLSVPRDGVSPAAPAGETAAMPPVSGWLEVDGLGDLPAGATAAVPAGGTVLLVANVNDTLLAYLNTCAACDSPLEGGALEEGVLACPSCSVRFDLPRAGRSVDDDKQLQLAPVPLLRDGPTRVRVALTA